MGRITWSSGPGRTGSRKSKTSVIRSFLAQVRDVTEAIHDVVIVYYTTLRQNFDDVTLCQFLRQSYKSLNFVSLMTSEQYNF